MEQVEQVWNVYGIVRIAQVCPTSRIPYVVEPESAIRGCVVDKEGATYVWATRDCMVQNFILCISIYLKRSQEYFEWLEQKGEKYRLEKF